MVAEEASVGMSVSSTASASCVSDEEASRAVPQQHRCSVPVCRTGGRAADGYLGDSRPDKLENESQNITDNTNQRRKYIGTGSSTLFDAVGFKVVGESRE